MAPVQPFVHELADVVAHSLSVVSVQAQAAEAYVGRDAAQAREHLEAVRRTAHDALAEMRRLCSALRPELASRLPQPSLERLGELVEEARTAGIELVVYEEGDCRDLPPGIGLTAYRIVQEALANVHRHAGPVAAAIRIAYRPDRVDLAISNTPGRTSRRRRCGEGLAAIRERARVYGGGLEAGVQPDGSFAVRAWLPR